MADVETATIETDVLIVGTGPAGSSLAALLSSYGVENMAINRYRWLAQTPRAHITNQRTMEVLRDLGPAVEAEAYQQATPQELMGENVFCTSLTGEELGRMKSWGMHPPSNGFGSNTSIQDSFNLAWKLAMVLRGEAGPALLDTYSQERAPIANQIVTRANQSIGEFGPIIQALGLEDASDPDAMQANMDARCDASADAEAQRGALRKATAFKSYEFDAHGVEMNQRYVSDAIVGGGRAPGFDRDAELHYQPTTHPGARLPHVWLFDADGGKRSTLDLAGHGLFTGIGGEAWVEAVQALGIKTRLVGPRREWLDHSGDWAQVNEVGDTGCLLVRPDRHIAWRSKSPAGDCDAALSEAFRQVLALGDGT